MDITLAKFPAEKSSRCQWFGCQERGTFSLDAPQFFNRGGQALCGHHILEILTHLSEDPLAEPRTRLSAA